MRGHITSFGEGSLTSLGKIKPKERNSEADRVTEVGSYDRTTEIMMARACVTVAEDQNSLPRFPPEVRPIQKKAVM